MKAVRISHIAPAWLLTYAGVVLLMGVLVNLATSFAQYIPNLTLPSMQEAFHLSYTQAGVLVTGASVIRMGGSLAFGTLAPRYGSRVIIGAGTIGSGLAMFFLGASPNFLIALIAMALIGLTTGAALTPMMGLLSAWFDVRTRGLAVGLAAAGGSVSLMVAGVAVPLLTGRSPGDGWRHAWYIFGVLVLAIGILSLIFIRDRPRDEPESIHRKVSRQASRRAWPLSVYRNPLVWLVTSLAFCSGWATGIFNTFFGVYLSQEHGIDLSTTGHLLILMGFLSIGSGILWGRVSDRLGRGQGFLLSYLILAIAFALFWLVPVIGVLVASSVLVGLTMRAAYTLCAASAGDYVPVQFSAAAFGLISLGAGLGSSISPIIAGAIADATSDLAWTFALAMLGAAAGVAASFLLHRCSENRPHPQPLS